MNAYNLLMLTLISMIILPHTYHKDLEALTWQMSNESRQFGGIRYCNDLSKEFCERARLAGYNCYMMHITPQHWVSIVDGYVYDTTHNSTYSLLPDMLADYRGIYIWRLDHETT